MLILQLDFDFVYPFSRKYEWNWATQETNTSNMFLIYTANNYISFYCSRGVINSLKYIEAWRQQMEKIEEKVSKG
jgi:hypothetical protein